MNKFIAFILAGSFIALGLYLIFCNSNLFFTSFILGSVAAFIIIIGVKFEG